MCVWRERECVAVLTEGHRFAEGDEQERQRAIERDSVRVERESCVCFERYVCFEPYFRLTMPYILSKEPCILSKEPYHRSNEHCDSSKEPCILSTEPYSLSNELVTCPIHAHAYVHTHTHTHTHAHTHTQGFKMFIEGVVLSRIYFGFSPPPSPILNFKFACVDSGVLSSSLAHTHTISLPLALNLSLVPPS